MAEKPATGIFFFTNALKALKFLADAPEKEFTGSDVQDGTGLSRSGVYFALRDLEKQGLVSKHKKGRGKLNIYKLMNSNPAVKQYKVLKTVLSLEKLIEKLKPFMRKTVLFGSASRGEDTSTSDIDLFILCKDINEAKKTVATFNSKKKIQAVVKTQVEYSAMKGKDPVFSNEIDRGIVLWGDEDELTV
ncbi:MAG: nucleotidyltransferase domain-containing protein [Elusimicrobiota bacterium]